MDQWIQWACRCRLPPFKTLAQTCKTHIDGMCHILTGSHANAAAESINADIQGATARVRGFRTFGKLRTVV